MLHGASPDKTSAELYTVQYVSPSGDKAEWNGIADFDAFKAQKLSEDPERRKGSWFAIIEPERKYGFRF